MVYTFSDFSPCPSSHFFICFGFVCVCVSLGFSMTTLLCTDAWTKLFPYSHVALPYIHFSINIIRFVVAFVLIVCSSFLFRFFFFFFLILPNIHPLDSLSFDLLVFMDAHFHAYSQNSRSKEKKIEKEWKEMNGTKRMHIHLYDHRNNISNIKHTYRTQHSPASGQMWKKVILNWYFGRKFCRRRRCHCCRLRIYNFSLRTHYSSVLLRINFLHAKQEDQKTSPKIVSLTHNSFFYVKY